MCYFLFCFGGGVNFRRQKDSIEDVLKMIMDGNSSDTEQVEEYYNDDVEDEDWTVQCAEGNF